MILCDRWIMGGVVSTLLTFRFCVCDTHSFNPVFVVMMKQKLRARKTGFLTGSLSPFDVKQKSNKSLILYLLDKTWPHYFQ